MFFSRSCNFGKKNYFIQEANARSRRKGTVGTFSKWCKHNHLDIDGKVSLKCINKAKKSGNTKLIRRAVYAQNIGGYTTFGKKKRKCADCTKKVLRAELKLAKEILNRAGTTPESAILPAGPFVPPPPPSFIPKPPKEPKRPPPNKNATYMDELKEKLKARGEQGFGKKNSINSEIKYLRSFSKN